MAGSSVDVVVKLLGDTSGFTSAIRGAQKDAGTLAQKMNVAAAQMKTAGRTMTLGFTVPVVAGLAMATKAAIDEEKEMALLAKALTTNTKATKAQVAATEQWITKTQTLTGVQDGELRPALAALVAVTKDTAKAQDLLSIALDISAAKGKPLQTVTEALAKAQLGNVGGLGRLGIATKDAEGKTLSFEAVMKNATKTFGGAAATAADTSAGKMNILKATLADLTETVGTMFIPVFQKLVAHVQKAAEWVGNLSPVWQKVIVVAALVVAALGPLLWILGALIPIITAVAAAGGIAAVAMGALATAIAILTSPITLVIAAIALLVAAIVILYRRNETFREVVQKVWAAVKEAISIAIGFVVNKLRDFVKWIKEVWDRSERLQSAVKLAWQLIKTSIAINVALIKTALDVFWKALKFLWDKAEPFRAALAKAFNGIATVAKTVWDSVAGYFSDGYDRVASWINKVITVINKLLTQLHIDPLSPLTVDRRGGGGEFSAPSGGARAPASKAGSIPSAGGLGLMDNGGTGAPGQGGMGGGSGASLGGIADWVSKLMGGIGWPSDPGGAFGGVSGWMLEVIKKAVAALVQKSGGPGRAIIEWAKTQIGKPYLWGATGPDAYDCSGLIYRAYLTAGQSIPRTGMWMAGRQVSGNEVRPADVGFFSPNNSQGVKYGHVKMYAGDGMAIESASGGVHMSPWGGASEVRTYLSTGGVYVGEKGPEAVLPLTDKRAMAKMAKAGMGGTYHDNRQFIFNVRANAQGKVDVRGIIAQAEAMKSQAATAARRGSVRG